MKIDLVKWKKLVKITKKILFVILDEKWCLQDINKKIRNIKMKKDRMWWKHWKWCRQEKNKKIEK